MCKQKQDTKEDTNQCKAYVSHELISYDLPPYVVVVLSCMGKHFCSGWEFLILLVQKTYESIHQSHHVFGLLSLLVCERQRQYFYFGNLISALYEGMTNFKRYCMLIFVNDRVN